MSSSEIPTEWSEESSNSWSHSRLPVELSLIAIGDEWDVEVTPLSDDMPWHDMRVNVRREDEEQVREVAVSYMNEFDGVEIDVREEFPELSEKRKVIITASKAILNLR